MKRIVLVLAFCIVALTAQAQANLQVSTGDKNLDSYLSSVSRDYAAGRLNRDDFKDALRFNCGLSYDDFNSLISKGYNAGDAYTLGLLHKKSGKSIDELVRNRRPGQGWGELAHQLGIPPSELNKMRVAMNKQWKENQRGKGKYSAGQNKYGTGHEKYGTEKGSSKQKSPTPGKGWRKGLGKGNENKKY